MESAPLLGILSSWEVIVTCLLLMLLLPLVFAVASSRSPARHLPVGTRARKAPVAKAARVKAPTETGREDAGREQPGPEDDDSPRVKPR